MSDGSRLGGRLAPKIANTVAESTIATRRKTAKITHDLALKIQDSFFRIIGAEHRRTISGLYNKVADTGELPPWADATFKAIANEEGQGFRWLAQAIGGQALGVGLGALLNNELGPAVQGLIQLNPHGIIDPGTAAQMQARGIGGFTSPSRDARKQGIDQARFQALVEVNRTPLDPSSVLELIRRKYFPSDFAGGLLKRAGYSDDDIQAILFLTRVHITPEQAADMVVRGIISQHEGATISGNSGIAADDFDKMVKDTGESLAPEALMEALRRGIISESTFEHGIKSGRTRNEWIDTLRRLRYSPPPSDTALSAATQNLLPQEEARRIVAENGMDPSTFHWVLESYGRPLSPEEAGRLYNRGVISKSQVRQMFLESSIKNKYVDLVFKLAERIPSEIQIVRLIREGAYTKKQGIDRLMDLGFNRTDATAFADLATKQKTKTTRDLAVGEIQELYGDHAITKDAALKFLKSHGYDEHESEYILSIVDLRRTRAVQNAAVGKVRAEYIVRHIDETEVVTALDTLHIPSDQRTQLIDAWNVERDVSRPELSAAQILTAAKKGIITSEDAHARLLGKGYRDVDARILIATSEVAPPSHKKIAGK